MTYDRLKHDIIASTEDDGPKFVAELPFIIDRGMLMTARALPLEMFNAMVDFALSPNTDIVKFSTMNPTINPITVDYLTTGTGEMMERRSQAYVAMHRGRGTPSYFCDIVGGIKLTPTPFRSEAVTLHYMTRPTISPSEQSNWYSINVYDLLFHACMIEAFEFLVEPSMADTHRSDFGMILSLAKKDHQDMLRANIYQPLAAAPVVVPKGAGA